MLSTWRLHLRYVGWFMQKFGLAHHNDQLKKLGSDIKEINELKREASKRLEENIEREKRE